jgi:hypothetical protein
MVKGEVMWKYFYDMEIRGYEIMGVNKTKIDRMKILREAKGKWKDFLKELDLSAVVNYFEIGVDAQSFTDMNTGRILTAKDDLMFGFNQGGYQYTLRRQPLNTIVKTLEDIVNQTLQGSGQKR